MKIAIATDSFTTVAGHAGKSHHWLVYDCTRDEPIPPPTRVTLERAQLMHYWQDDGPHPLDGVEIVVAASAGDGFVRHMQARAATVLLTGASDPALALEHILKGAALPETRFDITTALCKLKDRFSRYSR
ncbi:MAG: hypothetical protein RBT39_10335 [Azoarcus sp.]|nr:hypothetical protein [Azoarcus sp.]MDD2874099.1 hypothetical protein [Azoarcus sp.]MDX9837947.1 hypothetical protein [Azoarcus sp.]